MPPSLSHPSHVSINVLDTFCISYDFSGYLLYQLILHWIPDDLHPALRDYALYTAYKHFRLPAFSSSTGVWHLDCHLEHHLPRSQRRLYYLLPNSVCTLRSFTLTELEQDTLKRLGTFSVFSYFLYLFPFSLLSSHHRVGSAWTRQWHGTAYGTASTIPPLL
jgi:hypothetical protein